MRLTLDLNSEIDSIDRGRDILRQHWNHSLVFQDSIKFLEGLIMHSCSKSLPPILQMDNWTKPREAFIFL